MVSFQMFLYSELHQRLR